jgi:glycosyltransferase involved in cell wall biosynthesis
VTRIATDIESVEIDGCLLASDVVIDLRSHTAGEMPATLMRAFAAGRPAITADLPQLRDLDGSWCRRMPLPPAAAISSAGLALLELGRDRLTTRHLGLAAQAWVQTAATPVLVAAEHRAAIDVALATPRLRSSPPVRVTDGRSLGVTIVGDLTATTGLMEAGRRLVAALESAGVALDYFHHPCIGASHNEGRDSTDLHRRLPAGRNYPVELWLANLNEFVAIPESLLRPPGLHHRVIGSWFWELPTVVEPFASQVRRVDEIWAGSPFVRDTLQMHTTAPIVVVPVPVSLEVSDRIERRDLGLSDDDVLFFYDLDANSTAARKNPFGLITAFSRAFAGSTKGSPAPRLVLKGANLHAHIELRHALQQALLPIDGVLIDAELSRSEMNALVAMSDVYVSLHRAEGFGLGKAEAMYLGKPVVTSVYPEVWTFPMVSVACPVRARLRPITEADHAYFPIGATVYRPGLVWAEPDLDHAARWLTRLYHDPDLRRRVGAAGARVIRAYHSVEAARDVMVERLQAASGIVSDPSVDDGPIGERVAAGG